MIENVTLYTKPNCPQCVQVKALFDKHGIVYDIVELNFGQTTSNKMMEVADFKAQNPTVNSMPFFTAIDSNGDSVSGGFYVAKSMFQ